MQRHATPCNAMQRHATLCNAIHSLSHVRALCVVRGGRAWCAVRSRAALYAVFFFAQCVYIVAQRSTKYAVFLVQVYAVAQRSQ